ncbi:cystine transport system substrate-binding protein [Faunimonas pinastri]|uniref:Cystine transport system substrate-binding protein n=1 Tax=Faunimonas pinastri TaxID=1855383 RepID=A0A1H9E757_9HYPH|nr:transporter substrate-binding domain-containing protein [Faunimonas pinastri]SEQ21521.1 cystine transport system substrate-binding protein [Faunimonas pinastri]
MNRKRVLAAAFALPLALSLAPSLGSTAFAADDTAFGDALGAPKPINDFPKPWPLKHLVTSGTLTIGTTGSAPPRTFVDPASGKLTGSYVDLFSQIGTDLGLKVKFVQIEWSGILPGLAANRFDLACDGASWTKERLASDQFLMTAPTSINASVAITRKDTGIKTFADANGKPLGGVRGENYLEDAKTALPKSPSTEFPGMPESLIGLQNGQVDLVATNLANALDILATAPNKDDLALVGPALHVFPQGLCVNPRESDLLVATNMLLGNYRADGTLKNLVGKYAPSTADVDFLDRIGY